MSSEFSSRAARYIMYLFVLLQKVKVERTALEKHNHICSSSWWYATYPLIVGCHSFFNFIPCNMLFLKVNTKRTDDFKTAMLKG